MPPQPVTPKRDALREVPALRAARAGLPDRTWPDRRIEKAPLWCSVDLRDGNQALIDPMDPERKRRMFDALVQMGFKEIEVGLPVGLPARLRLRPPAHRGGPDPRRRHHPGAHPVPARADRAHLRVARGRPAGDRALLQLDLDPAAPGGVRPRPGRHHRHRGQRGQAVPQARADHARTPTSATSTRPRASPAPSSTTRVEICEAVMDVIEPTPDRPLILNLPATVEMYTPNIYADQIEWFLRHVTRPRLASCCRCTRTTTAAPRWPPPSSA